MASILVLLFIGLLVWFWSNSVRAKEFALHASAIACKDINAQFLDQTASLKKISVSRNASGRMTLLRIYDFDFSLDRETRSKGHVTIIGQKVTQVILDRDDDDGVTIL
jgi:hypothetical protein